MLTALATLTPQAPAPTPQAHAAPRPPGAHPFAELLRQGRAPALPLPAPLPAAQPDPAAEATDAPDAPAPPESAKPSQSPKTKMRIPAAPQRPPADERAALAEAASADAEPAERGADPAAAIDPALGQWLADLRPSTTAGRRDPAHGPGAAAAALKEVSDAGRASDGAVAGVGSADDAKGSRGLAANAKDDASARLGLEADSSARRQQLETLLDESAPQAHRIEPAASRAEPGANATPSNAAMFQPASGAAGRIAAPLDVGIATPLASPDFARALAVEVSVLSRDGVQRAELHLNPAEMGPVSVQIVMDGAHARVDFGADVAATRQAIEAGIPELAAALRDAGLTLTGGGVSQHAQGRGDADNGTSRRGRVERDGSADAGADALRTPRSRVTVAGGIDLYA